MFDFSNMVRDAIIAVVAIAIVFFLIGLAIGLLF